MRLTLGPILFNWDPAVWRDFYFRIADEAEVDTVCVGEVVCSKRWPFFEEHLPDVIDRLARSGKEVVVSSLALITLGRERRQTASLAQQADFPVEANDITTLLHLAGHPHVIGPFVNIYNEATLAWLAGKGAYRACLPPELPLASIAAMAKARTGIDLEVWAFGRVPLAISARCYHARLHKLTKDNCKFVCEKDPDGLAIDTLDDQRFLTVNGVQTLSSSYASVIMDLPALHEAGIMKQASPPCGSRRRRATWLWSPGYSETPPMVASIRRMPRWDSRASAAPFPSRTVFCTVPGRLVTGASGRAPHSNE